MMYRVQSYVTMATDVGMKYLGDESHLGWPHGVAEYTIYRCQLNKHLANVANNTS